MIQTCQNLFSTAGQTALDAVSGWGQSIGSAPTYFGSTADWGIPGSYLRPDDIIGMIVAGTIPCAVVLMMLIRSRARIASQRIEALRDLAEKGAVTPELARELLQPRSKIIQHFKPITLVLGWFMLFGGIAMVSAAVSEGWPDHYNEIGAPGVGLLAIALATMSTPIMLREFKRQGVV